MSAALGALGTLTARSQPTEPQYDEARVPPYTLPPLLAFQGGARLQHRRDWPARRRELLDLFSAQVYGWTPPRLPAATVREVEAATPALEGRARRQQFQLVWPGMPPVDVLLYRPAHDRPVPVFVGLNFFGNHSTNADPGIRLSDRWMRASEQHFIRDHRATERSRGTMATRWPLDLILRRDCAVMTAYCGDFAPDDPAHVGEGVARLVDTASLPASAAPERWGAVGMWAFGLSEMRRAAVSMIGLDPTRAVVIGHSRLGKAALWAGAQDEQFAMVVSNDSGCAGAALSRRLYGEDVARITTAFPHWFCPRFATYGHREADLPIDQHQLLALCAPRSLYVASAIDDRWADPRGEFLAAVAADEAYTFLGVTGLRVTRMPAVDRPVGQRLRYHVRSGGHDITHYDWSQYLEAVRQTLR
ncbi:MAG: acetylxylan esterase [Acidobacteria bacterium]|nr:acetylxylan esterase [Acidobacteriota bacterium]